MNTLIQFGKYKESTKLKNKLLIDIKNLIQEIKLSIKLNKKYHNDYAIMMNYYNIIMDKLNSNNIHRTYKSSKIVLDIETDAKQHILQIAYNMYDADNNLICSKDFYVYDGIHSIPFYPTINEEDIIKTGLSPKEASDIVTMDINNTNIIIGHNIKNFDLVHINKMNADFNNKIKDTLIIHDTMTGSRHIINAKNKIGGLKNPRLDEMLMFLCNKTVDNYHNALGDIIATFDCYKVLCDKYKCFQ